MPSDNFEIAVDQLLSHRNDFARDLLRSHALPVSGNQHELKRRLLEAGQSGTLKLRDIVHHLNEVEGWGNQHVYSYRADRKQLAVWRDEDQAQRALSEAGFADRLNASRAVFLPRSPHLSTVLWSPQRARFVWTVRRTWNQRVPDRDERAGDVELRAYERRIARGTTALEWNLISGIAMVMIQRLPSGTRYAEKRDAFVSTMRPLVEIDRFEPILVSRSIVPLARSGKIRERRTSLRSPAGGGLSLRSPSRSESVQDDPILRRVAEQVRTDTTGALGNFFWVASSDNPLESDLHFHIVDMDQRVAINGERREAEVQFLMERILELV